MGFGTIESADQQLAFLQDKETSLRIKKQKQNRVRQKNETGVRLAILRFCGLRNSPAWLLPETSPLA
jgi:hypothetical protein